MSGLCAYTDEAVYAHAEGIMSRGTGSRITLVWFSGTGGTERIGRQLAEYLETSGNTVQAIRLRAGEPSACDPTTGSSCRLPSMR